MSARAAYLALGVLAVLAAGACGPSSPGAATPGSNVVAKNVAASEGVTVTSACTPTGPEICFNAIDDNCNGVIDEGCGLATGPLQFTIAWGDSPANVDLRVTDPTGATVDAQRPTQSDGLRLDRDCPRDNCFGQNVENALFDGTEPPRGKYTVEIILTDSRGASLPVNVRFGARVGARSYGADLTLERKDDKKAFAFTL
jgi:tRNA (guanosine-2'-O-)-methyltransferase